MFTKLDFGVNCTHDEIRGDHSGRLPSAIGPIAGHQPGGCTSVADHPPGQAVAAKVHQTGVVC